MGSTNRRTTAKNVAFRRKIDKFLADNREKVNRRKNFLLIDINRKMAKILNC